MDASLGLPKLLTQGYPKANIILRYKYFDILYMYVLYIILLHMYSTSAFCLYLCFYQQDPLQENQT